MLSGTDFNLNFSQLYPDHVKDFLKQTMIDQDIMFRNQVNELHRLYTTQRYLMKDTGYEEFSQYSSGKVGPQLTFRPSNHQVHIGDYIGGEFSKKRYEGKDHFCRDNACYPEDVDLSLSIGGPSRSKNAARKSWKKQDFFLQDVIDLEESTEITSNKEDPESVYVDTEEPSETNKGVKLLDSNKMMQLDLNKDQLDESFFQSIDSPGENSSVDMDTGVFGAGLGGAHGVGSSSLSTSLGVPYKINDSGDLSANKACSIDLESTGPPLDLSDGPSSDGLNSESTQDAKTPCRDDLTSSSEESQTQHSFFDLKNRKLVELEDHTTHEAALSLLSISREETSTKNQHCRTKAVSNQINDKEPEIKVKPQYSLDDYELLVLNLKESDVKDECVSSNWLELDDEMDKRHCGVVKLRRGSRLKDFQRDVLPTLSTLSRHEIREDINIFKGVMRSREYKKLRAQTAREENWLTPVRSKRSKLNYVGRKSYN